MNKTINDYIKLPPLKLNEGVRIAYVKQMLDLFDNYFKKLYNLADKISAEYTFDESPIQVKAELERLKKEFQYMLNKKGREYTLRMYLSLLKHNDAAFRAAIKNIMLQPNNRSLIAAISTLNAISMPDYKRKDLAKSYKDIIEFGSLSMMSYMAAIVGEIFAQVWLHIFTYSTNKNIGQFFDNVKNTIVKATKRLVMVLNDQIHKANQSLEFEMLKSNGIKKFVWVYTYRSKEPREYHKNYLNGKICDMDDLPIIDEKTGKKGLPGELPNCKCQIQGLI